MPAATTIIEGDSGTCQEDTAGSERERVATGPRPTNRELEEVTPRAEEEEEEALNLMQARGCRTAL
jgi:hypothetical protein